MSVPQASGPAVPAGRPGPAGPPGPSPVYPNQHGEVAAELERVVERWRQLPLGHALSYAGRVRAFVQSLADRVAQATGVPTSVVPDCGPATLMDQLTVLVYDASALALTSTALTSTALTATDLSSTLAKDLANLRRELS